eukprot:TRINITY_DN525_c0_g1_i3.p2 TRINITY_DN525_c0_g1~~TRINITY_DN525_c0_g1_i3.p2  ORF type:complete len:292 (-),score=75.77 TRINITY_DN525_c0_g1_i3:1056-1931(-)
MPEELPVEVDASSLPVSKAFETFAADQTSLSLKVEDRASRLRRLRREAAELAIEIESESSKVGSAEASAAQRELAELRRVLNTIRPPQLQQSGVDTTLSKRIAIADAGSATSVPTSAVSDQTRAADLDARLARLEKRLGSSSGSEAPLPQRLSVVEERLRLLEPGSLEALSARVQKLTTEMMTASRKPEAATIAARSKVDELLGLMERWEPLAGQLPAIVDRLRALKALHEDAAQFANMLHALTKTQEELQGRTQQYDGVLKALEESIKSNAITSQTNVDSLAARVSALQK